MANFLIGTLVILLVLVGWILVQQMARRFAERHPEFGPYVEKRGCGGNCSCSKSEQCENKE